MNGQKAVQETRHAGGGRDARPLDGGSGAEQERSVEMDSIKYEFTDNKIVVGCVTLKQIRAVRDIPKIGVKKGDVGGFVKSFGNLSQSGDAWVSGNAEVYGDAEVSGNAKVSGDAKVKCHLDFVVLKNCWSSGRYFTFTRSNRKWSVGCFYGTGEELVAKAYKDSKLSGTCYEAAVRYVEAVYDAIEKEKGA